MTGRSTALFMDHLLLTMSSLLKGFFFAFFLPPIPLFISSTGRVPTLTEQKEVVLSEESVASMYDGAQNHLFSALPIYVKVLAKERKWGMSFALSPTLFTHSLLGLLNSFIDKHDPFLEQLRIASKSHFVSINAALFAAFLEAMDFESKKLNTSHSPFYTVCYNNSLSFLL